ncbi:cubilin-like [Watersipora subatra]|uniref:cubilin-like n=1 Tax=Watersipora subatra TaxID=2589382 RepID=UPI00355BA594
MDSFALSTSTPLDQSDHWYWANSSSADLRDSTNEARLDWLNISTSAEGQCLALKSFSGVSSDCTSNKSYVCEYPCQTYLNGQRLEVISPNFPNYYPSNTDCEWFIDVGTGTAVLQFQTLYMEESIPDCHFDAVEIYEDRNSVNLLGKFCGSSMPSHYIRSPSRYMYIKMVTDSSDQYSGFKALVQSSLVPIETRLEAPQGVVSSPSYPSDYPNNLNMAWMIDVQSGDINLVFTQFSLEPGNGSSCDTDSLTVRSGSRDGMIVGIYCGAEIPQNISSSTGILHLTFKTNSAQTYAGFRAIFWSSDESCIHIIKQESGEIESFMYPSYFSGKCTWYLDVIEGTTRINFYALPYSMPFHLMSYSSCSSSRLEIYDGRSSQTSSNPFRWYCGEEPRFNLTVPSNYVILTFMTATTGRRYSSQRFKASYRSSTNCSYSLTASNGTVTSPEFPSYYDPYSNCSWLINVLSGRVTLLFDSFALEEAEKCSKDRFEIYDGNSTKARNLGLYCGYSKPHSIISTGPQLFLTMTSDATGGSVGFSAQFWSSDLPCPMWGIRDITTTKFGNICYGLLESTKSWMDARDYCESHNSSLVRFESRAEFNAISQWLYSVLGLSLSTRVWTSAYQRTSSANVWYWSTIDGDIPLTNDENNELWAADEPSTSGTSYMLSDGLYAFDSSYPYSFSLCEEKTNGSSVRHLANGCSPPPNIRYGAYSPPLTAYADAANITFSCYDGYLLEGNDTLICNSGLWSAHIPTCTFITPSKPPVTPALRACSSPPSLQNGQFYPNLSVYFHGAQLHPQCSPGFTYNGDQLLNCSDGRWIGTMPRCEAVDLSECLPPTNLSYYKLEPVKDTYSNGDQVTLYCISQTDISLKSRTLICLQGRWLATLPFHECPGSGGVESMVQTTPTNDGRYNKLLGGTVVLIIILVIVVLSMVGVKLVKYYRNREQKSSPLLEMEYHEVDPIGIS